MTWLQAALFYADHLDDIKAIVAMFNEDDAKSIKEENDLMKKDSLRNDLAFIKCHLAFLPHSTKMMEEPGLTMVESFAILDKVKEKIQDIPLTKGKVSEQTDLKYCQVTSVEVERSFSVYKHIFRDRRHSFKDENLEKVVVSNCFYGRVHGE